MSFNSDNTYWGQHIFETLNLSSLGIVCKGDHWFPHADFSTCIPAILASIQDYHVRIGYGFSMGAYGAIKFSRALSLTKVLAFSPQYSIDPADVWNDDRRLVGHFRSDLNAGMGIKPHDLFGDIFAFYDPYLTPDAWNVDRIADAGPIIRVRVPRMGHETINLIAGREPLSDILEAVSRGQTDLTSVLRKYRATSKRRAVEVANAAHRNHPNWSKKLFQLHCSDLPEAVLKAWGSVFLSSYSAD